MKIPAIALLALAASLAPLTAAPPVRAFPGAVGFGAFTPGGRGGSILRVTTLAADGPGSFAAAVRAKGPRIVVFEVGGLIDLGARRLKISEPFLTVAGATAPSPGITLTRGGLDVATHDVIIQHLSVRPGEAGRKKKSGWEADGLTTDSGSNILIDHCSFTWATDENLSASGPRFEGKNIEEWRARTSHHVTFSHCLIGEGLSKSKHAKGEHSKGSLLHDNATFISVIGNLYVSNMERNPLAKGGVHAVIANNWIVNPGHRAIHHGLKRSEWKGHEDVLSRLAIVGNVLEYGPDTPDGLALFTSNESPVHLFMADNLATDRQQQPVPPVHPPTLALSDERPDWPEGFTPRPAAEVKSALVQTVGARPWDRDPIDQRIIDDALASRSRIIDSENEVGGYPQRKATRAPFRESEWDLATMQRR